MRGETASPRVDGGVRDRLLRAGRQVDAILLRLRAAARALRTLVLEVPHRPPPQELARDHGRLLLAVILERQLDRFVDRARVLVVVAAGRAAFADDLGIRCEPDARDS